LEGKVDAMLFDNFEKLNTWRNIDFGKGGLAATFPQYRLILRGAIDELLITAEGKFIPLDFKTRGYPVKEDTHEHYRHQLDCYALLFKENNMPPADYGYLLFFWPEEYANFNVRFSSELIKIDVDPKRGLDLLRTTRDILDGPIPKSHKDCEFCLYRESI
jgi:RecB family exonuclease